MSLGLEVEEEELWSASDSLVFGMLKNSEQDIHGQSKVVCVLCRFVFSIVEKYSSDSLTTSLTQEPIKLDFERSSSTFR